VGGKHCRAPLFDDRRNGYWFRFAATETFRKGPKFRRRIGAPIDIIY
jgi:hypothetical protein